MKKTVLINGGSRGIGAAIVKMLSEKGYRVLFTYSKSEAAAKRLSDETGAVAILADSRNEAEIKNAVSLAGGVDILINNAAVASFSLLTDVSSSGWEDLVSVNLTAPFLYCREALPHMIRNKWGRIINIVSMWGETGASCEVAYSATKAGLIGLTKALAKEVGPSSVTVNAVSPGLIDTEMNARLSSEDREALVMETPLSRVGSACDVANAVLFLASEESSFITGDVLRVNGGFLI